MSGSHYRAKKLNNNKISLYNSNENKDNVIRHKRTFFKISNVPSQNNKISEVHNMLNEMKSENSSLMEQNKQLINENSSLMEQNKQLTNENSSLTEQNKQLTNENSSL